MKMAFLQRLVPAGLAGWAALVLVPGTATAGEIVVFAAASLTDSLQEIARVYGRQSGETVALNFGSSSTLARQIGEGAPADIFFSADEAQMDSLEKRGLIAAETRRNRLSNSLVIVVAADSKLAIGSAKDLTQGAVKRIALADPRIVPAGIYSKEYLEKLGLWTALSPKVVPTDNVRAALAAVESGNVEAGMVYKTDAAISRKVKIACAVPAAEGPAIVYPMALVKESKDPASARKFLDYLGSPEAGRVFEKYGFLNAK
ncbi:MAG: molybdate ABC transporter substrate-binding protein [Verrucomicrobiota bacterium]|jgi:molybdate transport system substrate-binding protein